jgi:hypothetical protein
MVVAQIQIMKVALAVVEQVVQEQVILLQMETVKTAAQVQLRLYQELQ